jgi:hypothetical protein
MADERLVAGDEFLLTLVVKVIHDCPGSTAAEIARLATIRSARHLDRRKVEAILRPLAGGYVSVSGVPYSQVLCVRRRGLLRRAARWSLLEVPASGSGPDASGAPVPARPTPRTSSGAAAASLTFRPDDPPTNAIGLADSR